MALDPQARTLLDQLAATGALPLTESTPEEARAAYSMLATIGGQPEHKAATQPDASPVLADDCSGKAMDEAVAALQDALA